MYDDKDQYLSQCGGVRETQTFWWRCAKEFCEGHDHYWVVLRDKTKVPA